MKTLQLYLSDLKELLDHREFISARTCLKEISPIDLADGWNYFSPEERKALFRLLSRQRAVQLFEELEPSDQVELINSLQTQDAQELLQDLDPSETGRMVRGLPAPMIRQLTGIMKKGGQEAVQKFLKYPPQTVGALMRGRYVTLEPQWTAKQALERVQLSTRLRRIEETFLDTLMVVDVQGRLIGVVGLKVLVVAPRDMEVRELMERAPITLKPEADQEEAVALFNRYKHKGIPVVAPDKTMLGVVVYRDMIEVASQEVEEDFAKMAGTVAGISRSAFATAKARLPWLVATCLGGLLVSGVIRYFEPALSKIVALATFIPLIAGMGGNVGSQTATVMVRAIATGEVELDNSRAVVTKEMASGALLGLFYALAVAAVSFAIYGPQYGWRFPAVVSSAMLVSMFAAATLGAVQPLIFKRMGIDPATATAPFITTATDLLSNLVYFSLATYLLL